MIVITADEKRFAATFGEVDILSAVFDCMTKILYKTEYGADVFYLYPFYSKNHAVIVLKRKATHEPWRLSLQVKGRTIPGSIIDGLNDSEALHKAMEFARPQREEN